MVRTRKTFIALLLLMMTAVTASAQTKSAKFDKIWLTHNVVHNGQKCLAIHVSVTAKGMKGRTLTCTAYVDSPKGTAHRDTNGSYKTKSGQVAVSSTGKCNYTSSYWKDFVIYLPNDEIHPKSGRNEYYVHVEAWDGSVHLGTSGYTSFTMTGSGNNRNNGSVVNSDGSIKQTCFSCNGSGSMMCVGCMGTGLRTSYTLGMKVTCEGCLGNGKYPCAACSGKGYLILPGASGGGGYSGGYSGGSSGGSSGSSSGSSSSSSSRLCPGCGGSGKGPDLIKYGPNYTGEIKYEYCSKCGCNMDTHHYHVQGSCTVCGGRGRVR